ncbi:naphthalene 1,2-dioxygenase system ferredoxin--NAD(P)(+), reductase component [Sideroxyarcus emersonii]|uniref:Naphthalene 1,2-dioxygenase system ferredoxin--NAD(P)(+), reductase component n=1 Tax=Sideroxyarcus emersonii TaxID=2764705 RepID=A0AAN1XB74_9PROT|nr:FAD-binding oxidoreductase [Sideroxyarcus emersonii]BCK88302.1 naphthalene 1,2-dioxygenase system ferredoxin--NAD(P)(+), reductase component [Sideroxyarcus emersonii]
MPSITYGGQSYLCRAQESVLDCMTAHGVTIPSSCHSGLCQTCLMQAVRGNIPAAAQAGLKNTLAAQKYFLACSCYPEEDIEVALPSAGTGKFSATVTAIQPLNDDIVCLQLQTDAKLEYKAGQFINLYKDAFTARSYSLASVPDIDEHLQLHIRKVPNGLVSQWIHQALNVGDSIDISEATGDCFYTEDKPDQSLLLIGTGSGLAPLYGIIRDALAQGHQGTIRLYHGSETVESLYLADELRSLSQRHRNFVYTPCISGSMVPPGYASGMVADVALRENPDLSGWRVFLCGHPAMVDNAKKQAFFAGASMRDIYADPFKSALQNNAAEQAQTAA